MRTIRKPELDKPEQQRLFDVLHELYLAAGAPSVRAIRERIGSLSHDTVHRVLAGPAIPAWPAVEAVVRALDGDVDRIRVLWMGAARPPAAGAPASDDGTVDKVDEPIKVLIVEDHPLYRAALARVLLEAGCLVAGVATDGAAGVELAVEHLPDVVLMDLKMPKMDGIEATKEILRVRPTVRVLALTAHGGPDALREMLAAGATGFLSKDSDGAEILAALQVVHQGRVHISPKMLRHLDSDLARDVAHPESRETAGLTALERTILKLVADGETDAGISMRLDISLRTTRRHIDRIRDKTGLRRRPELIRYAIEHGVGE